MNCWEILGIDPTGDRTAIDRAYEQQKKFAADEELDRLDQAYREASGESVGNQPDVAKQPQPRADAELTAQEQQVVREVVIQVKALLNDSRRAADEGIWHAILAEPPADQPHLRTAIAHTLEPQVRPMADNGSFPIPVLMFLGDWFGWQELQDAAQQAPETDPTELGPDAAESNPDEEGQPAMTSFWPSVVGWIVALAVLAAVFDGMFGG